MGENLEEDDCWGRWKYIECTSRKVPELEEELRRQKKENTVSLAFQLKDKESELGYLAAGRDVMPLT